MGVVHMRDCFAFQKNFKEGSHCKALDVKGCEGVKCAFYKTKDQLEEQRIKILERWNRL